MTSSIPNNDRPSRAPVALSRRLKSSVAVIGLAALLSAGSLMVPWSDLMVSPAHATGGGGGSDGGDGPGDGGDGPGDGGDGPGDGGDGPGDGGDGPGDGGDGPGDGEGADAGGNAGSDADLAANDTDWPFNDPVAQQSIEQRLAQDPAPAPGTSYAAGTVGSAPFWSPSVPPVGWTPTPGCDSRQDTQQWHLDCQVENLMQRLSEIER